MRIVLVTVGDLKLSPYIKPYLNRLENSAIDYDVIFWNRDGGEAKVPNHYIVYNKKSDYAKSRIGKVFDFICYKKFVKRQFAERHYDKCIIFTSQTAVLLKNLIKKLPYILDIRDVSMEANKLYFNALKRIVEKSEFTVISSEGFLQVLPKSDKYRLGHNIPLELTDESFDGIDTHKETVKFGYFGIIRDFSGLSKVIDRCGEHETLELHFYGCGQAEQKLIEYARGKNYRNVFFHGYYDLAEKPGILNDVDVICNYYESSGNKLAVTNKYYDGIFSARPQVVNQDFYDHNDVEKYGIGIGLSGSDPDFAEKILQYYRTLDKDRFYDQCSYLKSKYIAEYDALMEGIVKFCKDLPCDTRC